MQHRLELSVSLPPIPEAAASARHTLHAALTNRVDPDTIRDAELLVTELVTNAVRHAALSPGDSINVRVRADDGAICVEVSDPGGGFDRPAVGPRPDRTGGFGLFLLDRMTQAWGIAEPPTRVWFELSATKRNN